LDERRTGLVVRGSSRSLPSRHIEELLGLPVLAELPYDRAGAHPDGLRTDRLRRRTRQVADELLNTARARLAEALRADRAPQLDQELRVAAPPPADAA
jgi:hypothetical protein